MRKPECADIVIVGGGYSGTMAAVNLMRQGVDRGRAIVLVDPAPAPGRGLAYGTRDDNFLLNVPAGNMSALDGEPNHFVEYCRTIDPAFNEGSFVSRRIYGDYLQHALQQAELDWGGRLQRRAGVVVAVLPRDGGFDVRLAEGWSIRATRVVLAPGHFAPKLPAALLPWAGKADRCIDNPWNFPALGRLDVRQPVLLIGTGLTAIDVLFRIHGDAPRKVYLLSRKGLLPQGHRPTPKQPAPAGFPSALDKSPLTVADCLRYLRRNAQHRLAEGGDWRDAINGLRAHTPEIWRRWSSAERRRFLRHAVSYWDVHRHRLAPVADSRLKAILAAGDTEVLAGRLLECAETAEGFEVRICPRGTAAERTLAVGAIINCTGPNSDLDSIGDPLIMQLVADGLVVRDDARIGLLTSDSYEVIGRDGQPVRQLHYVGPMLKAGYWEAIAVPELRVHTRRLAQVIAGASATVPLDTGGARTEECIDP